MGWTYTYKSKRSDIIAERTKTYEGADGFKQETLRKALVGNVLWTVRRTTHKNGEQELWIGCDLLDNGGKKYGWGYKDMSETMGPVQVSCPLVFLETVPKPDGEYAEGWRAEVRDYHARRRALAAVKPGDVLTFKGLKIESAEVANARPLTGWSNGVRYKLPQKYVVKIERAGAVLWSKAPKLKTKTELKEEALLEAGRAIRRAALGQDDGRVQVIFRGKAGELGRFMSSKTYDAISLGEVATVEDYEAKAAELGEPKLEPASDRLLH